jgi:peptide/nickel transport system substrate-binding protein
MRAGEIDGFFEFPPLQGKNWDRIRSAKTAYVPGLNVVYLSFDVSAAPWDDLHVRRAVAHAADRAGYVKAFLAGHGRVANAIPAPEAWAQLASPAEVRAIYARIPDYAFDLEAARRELAQSAHPDGFSAEITVPSNASSVARALVSLAEALKQIGITLRVREVPQNTWVADLYAHRELGLHYMTLSPDYVDPANFPQGIYPSAAAAPNNFNTANFRDPRVDRLISAQGETTDKAKRVRALAEVLRISGEQLPYLPLWWQDTSIALSERFVYDGFTPYYYNQNWLGKLRVRA